MADELALSGLMLPDDPTVSTEAARKAYVDSNRVGTSIGGRQQSDLSVTNSTTLTASPSLIVPIPAGQRWVFDGMFFYNATTASDIKFAWTIPTGASSTWHILGLSTAATTNTGALNPWSDTTMTSSISLGGIGTYTNCWVRGYIVTSTTGGNVVLQMAQNTAGATASILGSGSYVCFTRIA